MTRSIFLLAAFGLLLSLASCINDTPVDIQNSKATGKIDSLVIRHPVLEKTAGKALNTGDSPLLILGQADNKNASVLMKFGKFPDSAVVESAELMLKTFQSLGDTTGTMQASVYRVTQSWDEKELTFESFGDQFDPTPITTVTLTPSDSDTVVVQLDPDLVTGWIDSTIDNYGIYIRVEEGRFFKQVFSGNSLQNPPRLQLKYHKINQQDTTLTADAQVEADVFIFKQLFPLEEGPLYVSDGDDYRTLLKFDLSALPKQATINRAVLKLTVDSTHSFLSKTDGHAIDLFRLTEESTDPNAAKLDSAQAINSVAQVAVAATRSLSIDVGSQVQSWSFGTNENFGMLVVSRRASRDLYRTAFFSSKMDSTKAPYLMVYFTVPPDVK